MTRTALYNRPIVRMVFHPEIDKLEWHPGVTAFYDYWLGISPADGLPGRQHFDPLDLGKLLPRVSLYDVVSPQRYRCRVFSTRSAYMLGRDATGKFIDEAFPKSPALEVWLTDLAEVASARLPLYRRRQSTLRADIDTLALEEISIPLARDGRNVDMIASFVLWSAFR